MREEGTGSGRGKENKIAVSLENAK